MKILFLTSWFGLQENIYEQGFRKILGKNNVEFKVIWGNKMLDYDIICIGRDILDNKHNLLKLEEALKKISDKIDFVITDMSDDLLIHKKVLDKRIIAYFKRELITVLFDRLILRKYLINFFSNFNFKNYLLYSGFLKVLKMKKLFPLPLSFIEVENFRPSETKKYLISFIANIAPATGFFHKFYHASDSWKIKREVALLCKKYQPSFVFLGVSPAGGGIPYPQYLKIISESIAAIAPRAVGFDTARFWEIPYAGTILVAEKPRTLIPNYFKEGEHAFFFGNLKELKEILDYIKDNREDLIEMGRKAREFVMKYHSPEKRAEYVLRIINLLKANISTNKYQI